MNDLPKMEVLLANLHKYSRSLSPYAENYLPLFFATMENIPVHYAYVCPICIEQGVITYTDEFVQRTATVLTLDHFPPESVGGFETVLVCSTCNNNAGSGYEYALTEKVAEMAFNSSTVFAVAKVKTQISNLQGRYSSTITVGNDGKLIISFKPNPKANTKLLDEWLDSSGQNPDWTAEVTIPVADPKKVSKALLKAAYLFCFESWGYEFVFSYTGQKIRSVLNGESEYPLENPSFWNGEMVKNGQVERLPIGVCYLLKPEAFKLFIVNIVLKDEKTGYENMVSVLIPGPDESHWNSLISIKQMLDSGENITLTMDHVREDLLSYGITDGYAKNWNRLYEKEI